ncbi:unnamed protein product [Hermetia illucens]|uniref:Uncharacterized protein n=1 Tax=Hermetia illucens TaxID=343691 RepID=A0A7R8UHP4_HERIL|nr:unnamed protein product [Hermetia illucens]
MSNSGERSTAPETIIEEFEYKATPAFAENCDKTFSRFKFSAFAEVGAKGLQNENHAKRIVLMRKEFLHFIKETEWQYEPVEKRVGQP